MLPNAGTSSFEPGILVGLDLPSIELWNTIQTRNILLEEVKLFHIWNVPDSNSAFTLFVFTRDTAVALLCSSAGCGLVATTAVWGVVTCSSRRRDCIEIKGMVIWDIAGIHYYEINTYHISCTFYIVFPSFRFAYATKWVAVDSNDRLEAHYAVADHIFLIVLISTANRTKIHVILCIINFLWYASPCGIF